eukprot:5332644-Heterocapsa_arctica.AAC.1
MLRVGKARLSIMGWHGVLEVATKTPNNDDGITGRSGGVAILVCNHIFFSTVPLKQITESLEPP